MNSQDSNRLSVTANLSFWELFVATLILIRYRWQFWIAYAVFPLFGLFLLVAPFITGIQFAPEQIGVAVMCFLFTPLVTALSVWSARRRNRLTRGPFTYAFDAEGMHTSGASFSQTIRWPAIPRVRRSKNFLFIFFGPRGAYAIPMRAINDPGFFDKLRDVAGGQTDFVGKG